MKICILFSLTLFVLPIFSQQTKECETAIKRLAETETMLNDWAQLNRYKNANAAVIPPVKGETRVVFIGDSITDIWDEKGFGGFFPGKPYINRGIGGQTTSQMLLRFHADVIDNRPSVVVLLAGTNDISGNTGPMSLKQTGDNISAMSEFARAHRIRVVLSSVLPVSDSVRKENGEFYIQTRSRPPSKIKEMNEWLKAFAERNGYTYLDYYAAMVDENEAISEGLTFDGLHPNAKGYAIMAPLADGAIQKALRTRK